jgi:hypothetical protein
MNLEYIFEVGIDEQHRLYIRPEKQSFEYIYRAAAEVGWDNKEKILFSPKPRERSYHDWYRHIIDIVKDEYGTELRLTEQTKWKNVSEELRSQIIKT